MQLRCFAVYSLNQLAVRLYIKCPSAILKMEAAIQDRLSKPKKSVTRVKYTCPGRGANAWGKGWLHLICADCEQSMTAGTPEERERTAKPSALSLR
jgi:hypothetical protein